jgi:hypothetical protein
MNYRRACLPQCDNFAGRSRSAILCTSENGLTQNPLKRIVVENLNGKYVIRSESESQEKIDIPVEFSRITARKNKRHVWDNGCMLAYQSNLGLRNLGLISVVHKFA